MEIVCFGLFWLIWFAEHLQVSASSGRISATKTNNYDLRAGYWSLILRTNHGHAQVVASLGGAIKNPTSLAESVNKLMSSTHCSRSKLDGGFKPNQNILFVTLLHWIISPNWGLH